MKCLVTGAAGQLGRAVVDAANSRGDQPVGLTRSELSVESASAVQQLLRAHRPDAVIHCAAFTNVDGCESERDHAFAVNGEGTANLVQACDEIDARLVYVSTDYVFDGSKREPYTIDDPTCPASVYGESKLAGERAVLGSAGVHYVARTSWVFGPGGKNFPAAILARARSGQPLSVVDDQVGSPTMTRDLADALLDLAASEAPAGVYHATNEGSCSWHEFALQLLAGAGMADVEVGRMSTAELGRPAPRPAYSVLDCSQLTTVRGRALPNYRDALTRYLSEELS